MKKIQFYTTYDWYGNTQEKILEIKNKDLFSEFCSIYETVPDFSVCTYAFYENEIEVIKKHIEEQKREILMLPEKRIKKLEEILKKYEKVEK